MRKSVYVLFVTLMCLVGITVMMGWRDRWNKFGRKVDDCFGIKSPHTKKYEKGNKDGK